MARRFSDIRRAARLNAALTAYQAYLAKPPSTTLPTYKPRPEQVSVGVAPFGLTLGADETALVRAAKASFETLKTVIQAEASCTTTITDSKKLIGFRPARISVFQNATKGTPSTETSKFTGQAYRVYDGERFACPFGAKAATNKEIDTAKKLIAAFKARTGFEINRVSVTPERQYNQ
jgi:hypothetical protein